MTFGVFFHFLLDRQVLVSHVKIIDPSDKSYTVDQQITNEAAEAPPTFSLLLEIVNFKSSNWSASDHCYLKSEMDAITLKC